MIKQNDSQSNETVQDKLKYLSNEVSVPAK